MCSSTSSPQGQGVAGGVDVKDLSLAGGQEPLGDGIEGGAVADYLPGENRVGNRFEGHKHARERRQEGY